jgi:gamma-glutamylputrescine oxidase
MQISIWEKESFYAPQNIIIIGAGLVGLWSALHLLEQKPHLKITILEKGRLPFGASTRNAGFCCFGSPSEILSDMQKMGEEATWQIVEMRYKGLLKTNQYFSNAAIDYDPCGGAEVFDEKSTVFKSCADALPMLNQQMQFITGQQTTFQLDEQAISKMNLHSFGHLISNKLEGGLHSGKLMQQLLQKVQGLGAQIIFHTEVESFEELNKRVQIKTNLAESFLADQLLICTNGFTQNLLPTLDVQPARGQVLVTAPIADLQLKGTFHFDEGFYYFRNYQNRVLLGGARNADMANEQTEEMIVSDTIQQKLETFLQRIIPNTKVNIDYRWSGIMGIANDKMPIVQNISPRVFACVRMSGMGVALAPIVSAQISNNMLQS